MSLVSFIREKAYDFIVALRRYICIYIRNGYREKCKDFQAGHIRHEY